MIGPRLRVSTPLWPAGHLPHKEGDHSLEWRHLVFIVEELARRTKRLISLLVGEMAGRPEGGVGGLLANRRDAA